MLMASLIMWLGCRAQVVVKQVASEGSRVSWVFRTHFGGVLLGLAMYIVILKLLLVGPSQTGQGMWPLSMMMWGGSRHGMGGWGTNWGE